MKTQLVRVQRSFYLEGKPTKVESELELPLLLAIELRTANKVTFIEPPKPAEPAVAETAAAPAPAPVKAAKPQKGDK